MGAVAGRAIFIILTPVPVFRKVSIKVVREDRTSEWTPCLLLLQL